MAQKHFVFWSTEESVRSGVPSALAALEVVVAVTAYWLAAIAFETFTHLWLSVCVAPLLLLRSDQSIAQGVKWFQVYLQKSDQLSSLEVGATTERFWIALAVGWTLCFGVSKFLTQHWLSDLTGWAVLWRGAVVGLVGLQFCFAGVALTAGAGAVAGARAAFAALAALIATATVVLTQRVGGDEVFAVAAVAVLPALAISLAVGITGLTTVALSLAREAERDARKERTEETAEAATGANEIAMILPSLAIGVWLRSILIRIFATAIHLKSGFWEIPKNFTQTLFVVDIRYPAELVPGYKERMDFFTSKGLIQDFLSTQDNIDKAVKLMLIFIFFIPAYAYRLSIKSTCWLYLPLVYIAREQDIAITPAHLLDRLARTPREWLRRVAAITTVTGFVVTTLAFNSATKLRELLGTKLVSPIEYFFLINYDAVKPWQIFSLLSASITIYLLFAVGDARIDHEHVRGATSQTSLSRRIESFKLLMRLRNVFSTILILILVIHALLLLFSPVIILLPRFVIRGLTLFYGEYMPTGP